MVAETPTRRLVAPTCAATLFGKLPTGASTHRGECLGPFCFRSSLRGGGPICLRAHHLGPEIASTVNGSLRLMETSRGLFLAANPYDSPDGRRAVEECAAKQLKGISPGMVGPVFRGGELIDGTLTSLALVAQPRYAGTVVVMTRRRRAGWLFYVHEKGRR